MQLLIYFLMIFAFTAIPIVGLFLDDSSPIYGMEELKIASIVHVIIIYIGIVLAFIKIHKRKYYWKPLSQRLCDRFDVLGKIAFWVFIMCVFKFFISGHMIFSGMHRGVVRTSLGILGPLSIFISLFAVPALLSLSTVLYFFYLNHTKSVNNSYLKILFFSVFLGVMAGGKINVVMIFFPMLLQGASMIRVRYFFLVIFVGSLSIVLIGMFQFGISLEQSFYYNIYRATSLSNFGTLCVWNEFPDGSSDAYFSLWAGFGENIISYLLDVDRHSVAFLKYSLPRQITYLYYGNSQGAIDGTVNLTITAFGETVYWFGRNYYFIASVIFSFVTYKLTILVFKTRNVNSLISNTLVSVYFVSAFIVWLNSTSGSIFSSLFGFTTIIYMMLSYCLLKYIYNGMNI